MGKVKMIHLADLHLGASTVAITKDVRYSNVPVNLRIDDCFNKLKKIIKFAINKNVNFFVIAGDIFDTPKPDMVVKKYFAKLMKKLITKRIYVLIIIGNHDTTGYVSAFDDSAEFSFGSKYLRIVTKPQIISLSKPAFNFLCLPYMLPNINTNMTYILSDDFPKGRNFNKKNVLISHIGIDGCMVGPSEKVLHSGIAPELLRGYDYVALGDYHRNQKVGNDKIKKSNEIWYSGSIQRINMGEPEKKYFNLITFDMDNSKIPKVEMMLIKDRQYIHLKLDEKKYDKYFGNVKKLKVGKKICGKKIAKNSIVKLTIMLNKYPDSVVALEKIIKHKFKKTYNVKYVIFNWIIKKKKRSNKGEVGRYIDAQNAFLLFLDANEPKKYRKIIYNRGMKMLKEEMSKE